MGNHVWNNKKHEIMLKTSLQNENTYFGTFGEKCENFFGTLWRKMWIVFTFFKIVRRLKKIAGNSVHAWKNLDTTGLAVKWNLKLVNFLIKYT